MQRKIPDFQFLLANVALAATYFAGAKLGLQLALEHPSATAVWPPTGISIAAMLLFGYRLWPGVAIGAFISNVTTAGTVATSIGIAAGNTLEAVAAAWLVNRFAAGKSAFATPVTILRYVLFAVMLAPTVSATIGVATLVIGDLAPIEQFFAIWVTWWLGDAVSAIVIAPVIIIWCTGKIEKLSARRALQLGLNLALILVIGAVTFGAWQPWIQSPSRLAFLCIPPALWVAFSFRQHGASLGILILVAVAVLGILRGQSPFAIESTSESLLVVQAFMGVIAVTALIVSAVVDQNRRAVAERDRELVRRKIVEAEIELHRDHLEALVEQRTKALEESHNKLRFTERLASLGTLAAGLGHDMGNLLLPLRVQVDALDRTNDSESAKESIEAIRTSIDYLQRLANGLRLLAANPERTIASETVELHGWWDEAQTVLRNAIGRGVTLELQLPDEACRLAISRAALTQIVFNLVQNAADALRSQESGRVSVTVEALRQQMMIRLRVADNGPGMTDEVKQHCFEPFFTTKSRGISTGMGLVLVRGLVTGAGGTIQLETELGKGTTFTVVLPAAPPPISRPVRKSAVVDINDPRIGAFVSSELRQRSYEVTRGAATASADLIIADMAKLQKGSALVSSLSQKNQVIALGQGETGHLKCRVLLVTECTSPSAIRLAIDQLQGAGHEQT